MKKIILGFILFANTINCLAQDSIYHLGPDSQRKEGVAKGVVTKYEWQSKLYNNFREYYVYVPAQYDSTKPAALMVFQDGHAYVNDSGDFRVPIVYDNLIYQKKLPITICLFVNPGHNTKDYPESRFRASNRADEYDVLDDRYTTMLMDEIIPELKKKYNISNDPKMHGIGGLSSGAICAFTAAWEHPEEFSRVFSAIGTYTGLRGADRYPILVRKYEPKRIRIFLQDGSNDLNIYAGDWWKANESMERALTFSGYEVNHIWGEGGHNGNQGTAIFPQAMRWLWKDWPKPVTKGNSKNQFLSDLLVAGEDWELVGQGYQFTEGTATNAKGEVFYQDIPAAKTYKVGLDGKLTALGIDSKKASGTCFGPDGKRYTVAGGTKQVLRYDANEKETVIADSIAGNDLVVAKNGNIYVTVPDGESRRGKLYLVRPGGEKLMVEDGLKFPNGVTLSPDQTQLYATESASHWVWIYKIKPDGTLGYKQRYGWLHVPDTDENAWPDGLKCDTAGRVYVASRLGIQVMDQLGRVNAIIPVPPSNSQASNVCFGGAGYNIIYVTCGDKVYRRKLKTRGVSTFAELVMPVNPRL